MQSENRSLLRPNSRAGRWATALLILFPVFLAIFYGIVALGARGGDTFFSNPALAIPITLAALSGLSSGVVAAWAIVRSHDRALVLWLAALVAILVGVFISGEFFPGH